MTYRFPFYRWNNLDAKKLIYLLIVALSGFDLLSA